MQNATSNLKTESSKESSNNWGDATGSTAPKGQSLTAQHTIYMADLSTTDDDEDSEVEPFPLGQDDDDEVMFETPKFLLSAEGAESPDLQNVDPETQARLEALLEAAGIGKLSSADGKHLADPEMLRKLTSSVSCALDEAAAALSRMKAESASQIAQGDIGSLADACNDGDATAVKKLLEEGRSVNETTEEGDSLLSLACQAGYYELAQVLLAMRANVEDRGIKGDCTPLMEAASAGHVDIVKLLVNHGADVNAQSSSGNTPLMYACAGGHEEVVRGLLKAGANVEDHNENGHTPLMEAASAGHVGVAKILLEHGAGVNTHSNEFKESALTLACYKGHLEMVRFLLEAGADQEHKTDEMHTALMEASMDGHVEVARLLLDSGAQVNMPADSFESPLTLAACGGHVELAMLLLERGANIEEVNDEGYTPLMEAAREGHDEMVALLLSQGADINAQTEETQETALTLACCGGFLEVADFLIKAGADIELGASTPLMEAAQEGRLELVKYLLAAGANAHACTQTGDTALTYACENGHTDVADVLLLAGADLEHESEGGRTPLMKAARAGHVCTVQFLISRGADVNRQTTNNDHTPLSLACAGGHLVVVELLLAHGANPTHRLKDNSTMLIEAAKGGHTPVVQLLLDYPHNMVAATTPPDLSQLSTPTFESAETHRVPPHGIPHSVPVENDGGTHAYYHNLSSGIQPAVPSKIDQKQPPQQSVCSTRTTTVGGQSVDTLTTAELQQVKNAPHLSSCFTPDIGYDFEGALVSGVGTSDAIDPDKDVKPCERLEACINNMMKKAEQLHHNREEQILQKQQILEELQRVERELQEKAQAQLLLNAQTQLRIEQQQQAITPQCSLSNIGTTQALGGSSLLELSQGLASADGQLGLNFKSPSGLSQPQETKLSPLATGILSSCLVEAATSLTPSAVSSVPSVIPSDKIALSTVKAILKKEGKVAKTSKEAKSQLPSLELIEEMGKLNIRNLPENFTSNVGEVFSNLPISSTKHPATACGEAAPSSACGSCGKTSALGEMITVASHSQVQSQDSAVVSVGVHALQASGVQLQGKNISTTSVTTTAATTNKNLKSMTQIKNHLNSVTVNTCSVMGNIPLSSAGAVPQLPTSQQVVLSQQHYVPTSTVATQYIDPSLSAASLSLPFGPPSAAAVTSPQVSLQNYPLIDVNSQTDSNHDTALTLACAGGHEELVQLLLARGADIGMKFEHRDKKGFTPLILAATAGHAGVVDILLSHGADIEAQSERTKDTPLSLACSGGRYEVVEILLSRGANKEHRNVSDYTPLSLAASGGYVNIIKLLLNHGAEINSRTGSKLGISPLMLAAMNGHTQAVKLLLDMGSDINAQIETNRNTALTLACFQGRHEVVSLLLDRKANVEHRAKTGLTPLMEAASGGYVDVGRVLVDKGADVNALPVPSSRDTALTIAADKGHYKFVELLLSRGAHMDARNKKGNSPLWLSANGGHLDVVQLLVSAGADIDTQDNRKVSCIMAAFRKGHIRVVKWMVRHVSQFPSDQEMTRFMNTLNDAVSVNELLDKCTQCLRVIRKAKDRQAMEANKNATILLEELDLEKLKEDNIRKTALALRKDRKRKKKKEKSDLSDIDSDDERNEENVELEFEERIPVLTTIATSTVGTVLMSAGKDNKVLKQSINKTIMPSNVRSNNSSSSTLGDAGENVNQNAKSRSNKEKSNVVESSPEVNDCQASNIVQGRVSSTEKITEKGKADKELRKERKGDKNVKGEVVKEMRKNESKSNKEKNTPAKNKGSSVVVNAVKSKQTANTKSNMTFSTCGTSYVSSSSASSTASSTSSGVANNGGNDRKRDQASHPVNCNVLHSINVTTEDHASLTFVSSNQSGKAVRKGDAASTLNTCKSSTSLSMAVKVPAATVGSSPKRVLKREDGWREVVRNENRSRSKKIIVPANAISRVIGRGGCNINMIREVSGAIIEVEKQKTTIGDRYIVIKGSAESTRQAYMLIEMMVTEPDKDLSDLLPNRKSVTSMKSFGHGQVSSSSGNSQLVVAGGANPRGSMAAAVLKSGNLPGVMSHLAFPTQPPFSAPVRQPNPVRPGMPLSPAFPSTSAWPAFSAVNSSNSSGKKNGSVVGLSVVANPKEASVASSSPAVKTSAARQLFPAENKSLLSVGVTSATTKTTVSYTMAVAGNAKSTKTVTNTSNATFAKVTENKPAPTTASQAKAATKSAGLGNSTRPSVVSQNASGSNVPSVREGQLQNGPVSNHGSAMISVSPPSTSSSQSSQIFNTSASTTATFGSGLQRSASPQHRPTPPMPVVPQEYSPFNNLFSNVAQQSVWGKEKEESGVKGMNFASVAAANVKLSSSGICASASLNLSINGVVPPPPPPVDASKAPGYRGNVHISPPSTSAGNSIISSSSCVTPAGGGSVSPNTRSRLPNSAPSTPPLGPIAPPSGSVRKDTPPLVLCSSDAIVSLSNSAPAGVMTNPLTSTINLHHSISTSATPITMSSVVQPHSLLRPSIDLNTNFLQHSQTSGNLTSQSMSSPAFAPTTSTSTISTIPSIQSNLNPNAPDFASRSTIVISSSSNNSGGNSQQQFVSSHGQSMQMGRLSGMHDNLVPFQHVASVSAAPAVFSIPNLSSLVSTPSVPSTSGQSLAVLNLSQTTPLKHIYQTTAPPSLHHHNSTLPSEFAQHMARQMPMSDPLRLVSAMNAHSNMSGSLPSVTMGGGHNMAHLSQYPHAISNSLLQNQRSSGVAHAKEDCSNLSPSTSPHPSNPSSPLAMSSDHGGRLFGEDRKLPRPIGTERAHKKVPLYGAMGDCDGFQWRASFGSSTVSEALSQTQDDRLPAMQANFANRFGEGLCNILDNNHHLDANFSACRPAKVSAQHHGGMNSVFPPFMNGIPPQMPVSQLYATSAVGIDIWGNGNNMKPNLADGGLPPSDAMAHPLNSALVSGQILGGGPGLASGTRQPSSEHKLLWNNWSHIHM